MPGAVVYGIREDPERAPRPPLPSTGSMRRLVVTLLVSLAASVLITPGALAAPRELWPGVTYENDV